VLLLLQNILHVPLIERGEVEEGVEDFFLELLLFDLVLQEQVFVGLLQLGVLSIEGVFVILGVAWLDGELLHQREAPQPYRVLDGHSPLEEHFIVFLLLVSIVAGVSAFVYFHLLHFALLEGQQ